MKRWVCLAGILFSLVLMLLPGGCFHDVCPGPGETVKCFNPFFSMMPLGYGNFFPAAIVLLSIACALL